MTSAAKQTKDGIANGHDNQSDGDHQIDDWSEKRIGNLARRVLSMARKKATGAEVAPVAAFAQAPGGVGASNEKRGGGGAVSVVTVLADLPIMPQQPPVAQTKGITTKDRAVTRSANG